MSKLKKIYTPKGRAGEYAKYAVNLFSKCNGGCVYCFNPKILRLTPEEYHSEMIPRNNMIKDLIHDAEILKGDPTPIFLSFTCDIYAEGTIPHSKYVTEALTILLEYGLNITILTKGGTLSLRDFDLLTRYKDQVTMGATLVFKDDKDALKYEPNIAVTTDRCRALYQYHCAGIKTWASIEPIWSADDAIKIIENTWKFVDQFKIGKLNYHPHAKEIDWPQTIKEIVDECEWNGIEYMLKKDTAKLVK